MQESQCHMQSLKVLLSVQRYIFTQVKKTRMRKSEIAHAPPIMYIPSTFALADTAVCMISPRFRDGVEKLEAVSIRLSELDVHSTESSNIDRENSAYL